MLAYYITWIDISNSGFTGLWSLVLFKTLNVHISFTYRVYILVLLHLTRL